MARIVNDFGTLYRMSERKYIQFLRDGFAGKEPSASQYGKAIGSIDFTNHDSLPTDFEMQLKIEHDRKAREQQRRTGRSIMKR